MVSRAHNTSANGMSRSVLWRRRQRRIDECARDHIERCRGRPAGRRERSAAYSFTTDTDVVAPYRISITLAGS